MKVEVRGILFALIFAAGFGAAAQEKFSPVIAGPYRVLFQPEKRGKAVNDHTIFQDAQGDWRMIGILVTGINILDTPWFAHGVTRSLEKQMDELAPLFGAYPDRGRKYAPHVIVDQGIYHLYAGPGKIRHYLSRDGIDWEFKGIVIDTGWPHLRDTMVLKIGDSQWLMYATDRDNSIAVFESADLNRWSRKGAAFKAKKPAPVYPAWLNISACESPFVIYYHGYYYLSVCLTSALKPSSYNNTVIIRSKNPLDFGVFAQGGKGQTSEHVTTLASHASEYIRDKEGNWHITSCGFREFKPAKGAKRGVLSIAPLKWVKQ